MPIEIQCTSCQRKLKVADKFAGKKAKCPNCQTVLTIPGSAATDIPHKIEASEAGEAAATESTGLKDEWYLQTDDGEQYGPVAKAELDAWVGEGRVDASCQILCEGWEQWKWAEEVYPQLAESEPAAAVEVSVPTVTTEATTSTATAANPYRSPLTMAMAAAATDVDRDPLTPRAMEALLETRPWVLFVSILLFIGCGIGALACIFMVFGVLFAGGGPQVVVGLISVAIAVISTACYGYAASYLFAYGSRIGAYRGTRQPFDLEAALIAQKSFWKLVGIVTAVIIALYLLFFMFVIFMAVLGPAR